MLHNTRLLVLNNVNVEHCDCRWHRDLRLFFKARADNGLVFFTKNHEKLQHIRKQAGDDVCTAGGSFWCDGLGAVHG